MLETKIYGEIYLITCWVNRKQYVGQTTQGIDYRWSNHKCRAKNSLWPIGRAIALYGADTFSIEVIDTAQNQKELDEKEIRWIKDLGTVAPVGFNLARGGIGRLPGTLLTPEHKAKIRESCKGKKNSPEAIAKMVASNTGKKRTPEMVAEMSKRAKNQPPISLETKAKMSKSQKGRIHPPEVRAKIAASKLGKKRSPETCAKISSARRGKKFGPKATSKSRLKRLALLNREAALTEPQLSPATRHHLG